MREFLFMMKMMTMNMLMMMMMIMMITIRITREVLIRVHILTSAAAVDIP